MVSRFSTILQPWFRQAAPAKKDDQDLDSNQDTRDKGNRGNEFGGFVDHRVT